MTAIERDIQALAPAMIDLRHEIHAHPELGYEERETSRRILERIENLPGMTVRKGVAGTGIVATLNADRQGPCVALRADMDALPITEETGKPYASKHAGRMHACGHDGHVACLVGVATVLARHADALSGPVKFIFQPAEESGGGGEKMVAEGVLDNPRVDAAFALHGWPTLDVGTVGTRAGPALASTNPFDITIHGRGSHAAYPHRGVDPIVIAAHVVVALQTIVSRNTDPLDSVVVTVGKIEAGTAVNIIPPSALLRGTIRTLNPQTRRETVERVVRIARGTAEALGGRAEIATRDGYPVLVNDAEAAGFFMRVARESLGDERVDANVPASLGAEDFAYVAQRVPACFWRLGVRPKGTDNYPGLHHPKYDFSDDAIAVGVRLHCELAMRFAREWKGVAGSRK